MKKAMPQRFPNNQEKKLRVAIIGAGVAGCATAGALQDYGIDFVVYDNNKRAGGLWADNYPGAAVQSTAELYEYPCKRFPEHIRNRKDPPAPTAKEVCTYLDEYIDEKKMRSKFHFNTLITSVICKSETEWIIQFYGDPEPQYFSFVIICAGLVSAKPNMPRLPGSTGFTVNGGKIIHSSQWRSGKEFEGKRVLVVGNGKSATDVATAAAEAAKKKDGEPPIQLARRQTWYVPRYLCGCAQYKWAFHTRIGSALLPAYYEASCAMKILHFLMTPFKWLMWRIIEILLLIQYCLPYRMMPRLGTIEQATLENSVLITDERHLRRLRRGEVDFRIGTLARLRRGKAILSNGQEEDVDVVVLATGWQLGFDLFMDEGNIFAGTDIDKDGLDFCHDGLWLYRNVLPVGFKGMAFVGSNTLTFMNIFTSYIQAYWLAQLLAGERPWPGQDHMKTTVQREKDFKRKHYRACRDMRGASIEAYMQHYHDILFHEMKAKKPFNCLIRPIADLFIPVVPSLMEGCLESRDDEEEEDLDDFFGSTMAEMYDKQVQEESRKRAIRKQQQKKTKNKSPGQDFDEQIQSAFESMAEDVEAQTEQSDQLSNDISPSSRARSQSRVVGYRMDMSGEFAPSGSSTGTTSTRQSRN